MNLVWYVPAMKQEAYKLVEMLPEDQCRARACNPLRFWLGSCPIPDDDGFVGKEVGSVMTANLHGSSALSPAGIRRVNGQTKSACADFCVFKVIRPRELVVGEVDPAKFAQVDRYTETVKADIVQDGVNLTARAELDAQNVERTVDEQRSAHHRYCRAVAALGGVIHPEEMNQDVLADVARLLLMSDRRIPGLDLWMSVVLAGQEQAQIKPPTDPEDAAAQVLASIKHMHERVRHS